MPIDIYKKERTVCAIHLIKTQKKSPQKEDKKEDGYLHRWSNKVTFCYFSNDKQRKEKTIKLNSLNGGV